MAIDISDNVILSHRPPTIVVYLELEIIGGSSELGVQALSKLDKSAATHALAMPSTKDGQYKTYADYIEDMILRNSKMTVPEGLTPTKRRVLVDSILNDVLVRHRFVSRRWPRPKLGPDLKELNPAPYQTPKNSTVPPGKVAPNGVQLWGSTLLDFYNVEKMSGLSDKDTILTGSKLLGWCKANGEYENEVTKQWLAWAEDEKDPEVVPVYNVANLIRSLEESAFSEDEEQQGSKEGADAPDAKGAFMLPQPWPPTSAFNSTGYLGPWADPVPFSTGGPWCFETLPVLEEYIPQSRLPKKLIVHDPGYVLSARGPYRPTQEHPDCCVYEYELRLTDSSGYTERREVDEEDLEKKETNDKRILDNFLANPHSSTARPHGLEIRESDSGPINVPTKPAIYVVLPPCPPLATANEGHLYLSPKKFINNGNHSYVYKAEWELPRSCLVEEQICIECVMEDLGAILREEDGENGETRDRKWDELSGKMVSKETSIPQHLITTEGATKDVDDTYVIREEQNSTDVIYEGPYRVIHSRVTYQNLARAPYCKHLQKAKNSIHPLTTKVQVAAKLSIQYDTHLAKEAENYQSFPKHFFEHWSGYNLLPTLDDPTPIGPLVPQFYGYYVPKQKVTEGDDTPNRYLSPILLIEHCGEPIEDLSIDDKHECIALAHRLHTAKWYHGSYYRRNILRKPGPLSAHPKERKTNENKRFGYGVDWSFRLIDFGRSDVFGSSTMHRLSRELRDARIWYKGGELIE